ncbi:MAG: DUF3619 family protein [Betaproteobacteria bacterium]|nr:DUF3619 family protein [Betaproteobacteria bacterium]
MIEKDFGQKAAQFLNASAQTVPLGHLQRLQAARFAALDTLPNELASIDSNKSGQATLGLSWIQRILIIAPLIALVLVLASANLSKDPNAEIGELDAALLTGELPIDAFLDEDFDAWLKGSEGN